VAAGGVEREKLRWPVLLLPDNGERWWLTRRCLSTGLLGADINGIAFVTCRPTSG
jgi:hypothetical protein